MRHRGQVAGSILLSAGLVATAASTSALASSGKHKGTQISTVKTSLGRVVSNSKGRVIFRFMKDGKNKSACKRSCQSVWPPVMTKSKARAGTHVKGAHLGRTKKGQVTYYGHPLYYYVLDPKPGKTKGDGIKEFGAHWYVVSPTGKPVKPDKKSGGGGGVTPPTGPADVGADMAGGQEVITNSADGHTVYELDSESPSNLGCNGSCTSTWRPLLTKGAPTASGDADASQLGTVKRTVDGTKVTQVTYNNYVLYEFTGDTKSGQDKGQYQYQPSPFGYWHDIFPNGTPNPATHP